MGHFCHLAYARNSKGWRPEINPDWLPGVKTGDIFSFDQAALRTLISVCPSVCLSVRPSVCHTFWQCSCPCHRIILKFLLPLYYLVDVMPKQKVKVRGQRSRSQIYPNWAFPDCNSGFNSPMDLKSCTKLDVVIISIIVPYCFSRSFNKFQSHTGWLIDDLNPIWVRILGQSQLSNPSDLPCCNIANFVGWICFAFATLSRWYCLGDSNIKANCLVTACQACETIVQRELWLFQGRPSIILSFDVS